jgi:hypothetical protein
MLNEQTLAERVRLAARGLAALNDLANLDPRVLELYTVAAGELRALYPETSAGPTDPPEAGHNPPTY